MYVGHQVLLAPNQAMWILSPAMGGCVAVRVEGRSRDVLCLDRIPRAADPATWMLSEIGRVRGRRGRAHALGRPGLPARAGGGDRPRRSRGRRPGRVGSPRGCDRRRSRRGLRRHRDRDLARGSLWLVPASGNETTPSFAMGPTRADGDAGARLGVLGGGSRPRGTAGSHLRRADVSDRARPR